MDSLVTLKVKREAGLAGISLEAHLQNRSLAHSGSRQVSRVLLKGSRLHGGTQELPDPSTIQSCLSLESLIGHPVRFSRRPLDIA